MNSKILGSILLIAVVAGVAALFLWPKHSLPASIPVVASMATSTSSSSASTATSTSYTLADVAEHNSSSSCWSAINGKVYDLTSWIDQHPGGPEHILMICGIDGSAIFNAQHGGQAQPASILAGFYIGSLQQ